MSKNEGGEKMRLTREGETEWNRKGGADYYDGFQRAGVCPTGRRVSGGARSPGSFLSAPAKGSGSLVCVRSGARVLRGCWATIH